MTPERKLPGLPQKEEGAPKRFDPRTATPFVNKSVSFKLSVVRSFFEYLKAGGVIPLNPASTNLVTPPELPAEPAGRALSSREVRYLLTGPDREKPEGARDYALMLILLRLSMRVAEVCSLRASAIKWSHGRRTLRCKVKGGREEVWPLPKDVKQAKDESVRLSYD